MLRLRPSGTALLAAAEPTWYITSVRLRLWLASGSFAPPNRSSSVLPSVIASAPASSIGCCNTAVRSLADPWSTAFCMASTRVSCAATCAAIRPFKSVADARSRVELAIATDTSSLTALKDAKASPVSPDAANTSSALMLAASSYSP